MSASGEDVGGSCFLTVRVVFLRSGLRVVVGLRSILWLREHDDRRRGGAAKPRGGAQTRATKEAAAVEPRFELLQNSADELVARSVHGQDVLRLVGRRLDLLPELRDEVVDGPGGRRFLVTPDLIEDLLA